MQQPFEEEQLLQNVKTKLGPDGILPKHQRRASVTRPWTLPGFGGRSRVMTSFGNLPIEALRVRDPVKTLSGRYLEVRWIDTLKLDAKFLSLHPEANPIIIPRASLDRLTPSNDVLVSPDQKLRMPRQPSEKPTTSALSIIGRGTVARKQQSAFTYYLFHCGEPTSVNVEGLWFDVAPD